MNDTQPSWFELLTGFDEATVENVPAQFATDGQTITSLANERRMMVGTFGTPSLAELRAQASVLPTTGLAPASVREEVNDIRRLHQHAVNAGATFQVASQFNTLEMVHPDVSPEHGISGYQHDLTQGPACAIACGAGTIHRNYLVAFDNGIGQTRTRQIECLSDLAAALGHPDIQLKNGYALPSYAQLDSIAETLAAASADEREELSARLRVGVQWNTEVTIAPEAHLVTQAFCSALPIAYNDHAVGIWEPFARLILEAAYEATLHIARLNTANTGNPEVYLTLLGGGAFGNPTAWIIDAIDTAVGLAGQGLNITIVSHGQHNPSVRPLLTQ